MREIFLSTSVPEQGRGDFYETADPFLIQFAVRELITVCLGRRRIVWGGHPSITPMVHAVCQDFGLEGVPPVLLYQSEFFKDRFPEDNKYFETVLVEEVKDDQAASLELLRKTMLSRPIEAAVFVGGMEGIFREHELCRQLHQHLTVLALGAPGGAAKQLAQHLQPTGESSSTELDRVDFARLFHERLNIALDEPRQFNSPEAPKKKKGPPGLEI